MAKLNVKVPAPKITTHEGADAVRINAEMQLRRVVMACLLFEDQFYLDGQSCAEIIAESVGRVPASVVAEIAIEAREKQKLRHIPLFLVRELARRKDTEPGLVAKTLARVIQRADELTEFLAIYWRDGKQPLSAQVKKGLAAAFRKFDAYQFAKYDRDAAVKLRDALFLSHARPAKAVRGYTKDARKKGAPLPDGAELFAAITKRTLETPDTWEVAISGAPSDQVKAAWTRLLSEGKLGALALLRNLRNMQQAGVAESAIRTGLAVMRTERVLPFRFIAVAKHVPRLEDAIEEAMYRCVAQTEKLPGKTILIVDTSLSMYSGGNVSKKSDLTRVDAAAALAILIREVCERPMIYCTAGNDSTRVHATALVPNRRGFALGDVITKNEMREKIGGGGIFLTQVMDYVHRNEPDGADRVIVITDEQDCELEPTKRPENADAFGKRNYLINVAAYGNGIGYKPKWHHIDGWSEAVIDYIRVLESTQ